MENNSLYNINNNKILQDKLSTQMGTQKKLTRPSDDPVVAIRALRLRTSVSELTQFYEKNAEDADSWLDVTGKALLTVTDVLTDLSKKANGAANKEKTVDVLAIYLEQMKSLKDEFYSTGNVDYAGRYVFTGYRTDTTLTFTEAEIKADLYRDFSVYHGILFSGHMVLCPFFPLIPWICNIKLSDCDLRRAFFHLFRQSPVMTIHNRFPCHPNPQRIFPPWFNKDLAHSA